MKSTSYTNPRVAPGSDRILSAGSQGTLIEQCWCQVKLETEAES